jgi:hypothetical protein
LCHQALLIFFLPFYSSLFNLSHNNLLFSLKVVVSNLRSNLNVLGTELTSIVSGQAGLFTTSRGGFSGSNDISENASNAITGLRAGISISGGPYISTSSFTATATGIFINNTMLTGRATSVYGIRVLDQISNFVSSIVSSSVLTNYYGIRLSNSVGTTSGGPSASIDNYYSIRIDSPTLGVTGRILNLYGIHAPGSTMNHYFAGNILIQPGYQGIMDSDKVINDFPVARKVTTDTFFLGCSPVITEEQIEYIADVVDEFFFQKL